MQQESEPDGPIREQGDMDWTAAAPTHTCETCGEDWATCRELQSGVEFPIGSCCDGCDHGFGDEDNEPDAEF